MSQTRRLPSGCRHHLEHIACRAKRGGEDQRAPGASVVSDGETQGGAAPASLEPYLPQVTFERGAQWAASQGTPSHEPESHVACDGSRRKAETRCMGRSGDFDEPGGRGSGGV